MNISDLNSSAKHLDENNRDAILKLIDLKVEDDMKEILNAMHNEFKLLNSRFEQIDNKFQHVEGKFTVVYWVVGLSTTLLALLMAFFSLVKS